MNTFRLQTVTQDQSTALAVSTFMEELLSLCVTEQKETRCELAEVTASHHSIRVYVRHCGASNKIVPTSNCSQQYLRMNLQSLGQDH